MVRQDSFRVTTLDNDVPRPIERSLYYETASYSTASISASGLDIALVPSPGAGKFIMLWGYIHWADGVSKVRLYETDSSSRQVTPASGIYKATSNFIYPSPLRVSDNTPLIAYADTVSSNPIGTNVMVIYTIEDSF